MLLRRFLELPAVRAGFDAIVHNLLFKPLFIIYGLNIGITICYFLQVSELYEQCFIKA